MKLNLIEVGEAVYGPRFQRELAAYLGVNERTMRRWVAGSTEPPASLKDDLLHLLLTRRAAIDVMIKRLR